MGRMGIGNDTAAHALSLMIALIMHQQNEVYMVDSRDNQALYLNMEGADTLDVRLRFGQRGRAISNSSWALNDGGEPLFKVQGTHGQLVGRFIKDEEGEVKEESLVMTKFRSEGEHEVTATTWPKESDLRRQLTDFSHCIRNGLTPRNGLDHVRAFVDLRERVFAHGQSGRNSTPCSQDMETSDKTISIGAS
jgi:predicted dehydrogenase